MRLCRQLALWVACINLVAPAVGGDGVIRVEHDVSSNADGVACFQPFVGFQLEGNGTFTHMSGVIHWQQSTLCLHWGIARFRVNGCERPETLLLGYV